MNTQNSLLLISAPSEFLDTITYPRLAADLFELNNVVSRKKQLVPYLLDCLHKINATYRLTRESRAPYETGSGFRQTNAVNRYAWQVLFLNWALAFLLLALICFFSFSQLRYNWNWQTVGGYSGFFWRGWLNTLKISSLALVLSTLIGMVAALARRSGFLALRAVSRLYVELVRGTPLLVQISFAFYVVADAFHFQDRFTVGLFTLSLFSGRFHQRNHPRRN